MTKPIFSVSNPRIKVTHKKEGFADVVPTTPTDLRNPNLHPRPCQSPYRLFLKNKNKLKPETGTSKISGLSQFSGVYFFLQSKKHSFQSSPRTENFLFFDSFILEEILGCIQN
jgi:hypothetical protein